jgi:hypothetical protein
VSGAAPLPAWFVLFMAVAALLRAVAALLPPGSTTYVVGSSAATDASSAFDAGSSTATGRSRASTTSGCSLRRMLAAWHRLVLVAVPLALAFRCPGSWPGPPRRCRTWSATPERRSSIRSEGEPPQAGDLAAGNSSDRHWPRSAGHFATHATKLRVLRARPLAQRVGMPDALDRGGHRSPMSHLTKGRSSDG